MGELVKLPFLQQTWMWKMTCGDSTHLPGTSCPLPFLLEGTYRGTSVWMTPHWYGCCSLMLSGFDLPKTAGLSCDVFDKVPKSLRIMAPLAICRRKTTLPFSNENLFYFCQKTMIVSNHNVSLTRSCFLHPLCSWYDHVSGSSCHFTAEPSMI